MSQWVNLCIVDNCNRGSIIHRYPHTDVHSSKVKMRQLLAYLFILFQVNIIHYFSSDTKSLLKYLTNVDISSVGFCSVYRGGVILHVVLKTSIHESLFPLSNCSVVTLFWNFAQSTVVSRSCSIQKFKNYKENEMDVLCKWVFGRLEFKMRVRRISYYAIGPPPIHHHHNNPHPPPPAHHPQPHTPTPFVWR